MRAKVQAFFQRGVGETPILMDVSTTGEVDTVVAALREVMTATLDNFAKKKRSCARSKRWWTEDLAKLRRELGRERRRLLGIGRAQEARRNLLRVIRKAKWDYWNRFLQEAKGNDVWTAAGYTSPRIDKAGQALVAEDGLVAEGRHDREKAILRVHFPQGPTVVFEPMDEGSTFEKVDTKLVAVLLSKACSTSAPGDDRISAGIIKVFWQWDSEPITQIVRACIWLGHHPELWKTAKGVVIPKPGKPDYSKVRAYWVISLLDFISKLLERTAAHLIADHLERKRGLHEGQYGCRKRQSCIDAVAILMNRTQKAWNKKKVAGALFMDVKLAFNNVSKIHLGKRMEALGIEADLIRWTMSFMTDRKVRIALDRETGEAQVVDTGVLQGSPAAPILFVGYLSGIFNEVERKVPGVSGLSFVDDIGWWADGKDDEAVAAKLSEAATASMVWAAENGVAFDHGKTEAVIFWRKRKAAEAKATVKVGGNEVPFNKEATRWLRVWLDSQLTLKEHHTTRLKNGRNALTRLRRLTGQLGLSLANYRKAMTTCIQSVVMFGAELWWKGEGARGTVGRANDLQLLVNRQARVTTGAFWTTNLEALSMESGLRPVTNQLENRQWQFGLRLLSLPRGEKARRIVGADTAIGKRLATALQYTWTETEETVLLEDPESFDAELIQEDREEAKKEAEKARPGLVMFTDGSRMESGAAGYTVAWKNGQTWKGIKTHLGYNQEAFDAECTALARVLETASRRNTIPDRITHFTDAQATIQRMASDEPGPGQKYALEASRHIASIRRVVPDTITEIMWCPAHEGVEGNEKADEWVKLTADKPDARGVEGLEWMTYSDRPEERSMPLPRSLAKIKRKIAEKKWAEARAWAGGRTSKKKYKMPESQCPDGTVAGSTKRLASRFYQLKMGHCRTGQYLHQAKVRPTAQGWWCRYPTQTRDHLLKGCPKWKGQQRTLWKEVWKETERGKQRWKAHELLADKRCSQAVLDFLSSTDVGKIVPAVEVEDDAGSEASEWELRERQERDEEGREEELGGEGTPLFLPTPPCMASAEEG